MDKKIILASKSKVRKEILDKNNIESIVEPSNVDEDIIKTSLLNEKANPRNYFKKSCRTKSKQNKHETS